MKTTVQDHLDKLLCRHPVLTPLQSDLVRAFALLCDSFSGGGTLYVCGNGGSAADAEHIAGELLKGFLLPRPLAPPQVAALRAADGADAAYLGRKLQNGLRTVSLVGHPALSSAVANDNGGDLVFAQPLHVWGRRGDVLLAISTSGNARNVQLAARVARASGLSVVALTGAAGGALKPLADVCLCVPATETYQVQELHVPLYHALCAMLEAHFFA